MQAGRQISHLQCITNWEAETLGLCAGLHSNPGVILFQKSGICLWGNFQLLISICDLSLSKEGNLKTVLLLPNKEVLAAATIGTFWRKTVCG